MQTLVLLPGLDGTDIYLRPLLAALPQWISARVITLPARGRNDYAHLASALRAQLPREPYWLLGWSFSGPLALMLAREDAARVRGVILCSSFLRPPQAWMKRAPFAPPAGLVWLYRVARRLPFYLLPRGNAAKRRDKAETWRHVPARTLAARMRAVLALDAAPLARTCPVPLHYLAAARDRVVPHAHGAEILGLSPGSRLAVIEGPHMALYTHPHAAAQAISAWLAPPVAQAQSAPHPTPA
jgi:pimeloyl-ACP methyl ester carboxylesterase